MTHEAHATPSYLPAALSLAMPGFGQFIQGRILMAGAQLFLAGLVWAITGGHFPLCGLIPIAHMMSAISAANYRPT